MSTSWYHWKGVPWIHVLLIFWMIFLPPMSWRLWNLIKLTCWLLRDYCCLLRTLMVSSKKVRGSWDILVVKGTWWGLVLAMALNILDVTSNTQSMTLKTIPVTSTPWYHAIYSMFPKTYWHVLALGLLHPSMVNAMISILYLFFKHPRIWPPALPMLHAIPHKLYLFP